MRYLGTHVVLGLSCLWNSGIAFQQGGSPWSTGRRSAGRGVRPRASPAPSSTRLQFWRDDGRSREEIEEEARLQVLESRRYSIRAVLRAAEAVRNFRLASDLVPELDPETGKPLKSDSQAALSLTAFVVAAGAILLRVGGRAALVSAVGLDFASDNPELKEQLDQILQASETMDPVQKLLLFTAGWTAVKVLCFDAGGVVLAFASGILFGGVLQGAAVSAAAATVGSSVAFWLAKLETPLRKKALGLLDEYPSLRGIEKVVAQDGLKAILTLRLAPILPIPIGLYNYVYGVTNVPYFDFAGGIFLGSFKPYLLDSYLGYFGKSIIEGDAGDGWQDLLLLGALGFSVLVGVFASQLANETWESVLEEVEAEKQRRREAGEDATDAPGGPKQEFLGLKLPNWVVKSQLGLREAEDRVRNMIVEEYEAKVWNYTKADGGPPSDKDPARLQTSQEAQNAYQGFDVGAATCDGLMLSPLLFQSFLKYADPLYDESKDDWLSDRPIAISTSHVEAPLASSASDKMDRDPLERLRYLRSITEARIMELNQQNQP